LIPTNKARSLYIHLPFCLKKCRYCAFTSFPGATGEEVFSYLNLLAKELKQREIFLEKPTTIYVGGGTPTYLSLRALEKLREILAPLITVELLEFTFEANPGIINKEKIRFLKEMGVNRLSLGAQSFNDAVLQKMGRAHSAKQILEAYNLLKEAGFININLDLIVGYPGESRESFLSSIKTAIKLDPWHLSLYDLKVEEKTLLFEDVLRGVLVLPDEDEVAFWWEEAIEILEQAAYERYEIANFAKDRHYSLHNLTYWNNKPYLGLGVSAHSKVGLLRFWNPDNLKDYQEILKTQKVYGEQLLTIEDDAKEEIILKLRLKSGLNLNEYRKKYQKDFLEKFGAKVQRFIDLGLMAIEGERLYLTRKGSFVANTILIEFI